MNNIKVRHYKIHLEPDLTRFVFEGRVDIYLDAPGPTREVSLNALDLAFWECRVIVGGGPENCSFSLDPNKEVLTIFLPQELDGEIALSISYTGKINNKMAGFYRSSYVLKGTELFMAVTQFEESDARRAFPCMDFPAAKATFDVEIVVDAKKSALSNMPIQEEKDLGEGRKLVTFERTPKMSTYLLFFAAGDLEFIEDPGDVLIRVVTVPGASRQGRFSLEFARKALTFAESYYGINYPLPKLDLLAIADFAAGAMENWGAMTFRENLLLHDPDTTSKAGEERICEVIAHELAHQWFGDLVTPEDWKYLWLNESFATYFGYRIVGHYYPEWDIWDQFIHGQTATALDRDALYENFPIEIPGGEHVVINVSTAPIIYNKGASILRQVEGYVGGDHFREGLVRYLKTHAYGCATSHDFWEALGAVSSKPVAEMMENWIGQAGFPLIEVRKEENRLILRQERFTYMPGPSDQRWLIPLSLRLFYENGASKVMEAFLKEETLSLQLERGVTAYKINDDQCGFYRVKYVNRGNLEELGRLVQKKALGPVDRWGLQNDFYALVKKGDMTIDEYLDFLSHYPDEDAFLPLIGIASNLHHAYVVSEGRRRDQIASLGADLWGKVLDRIGYEPHREDRHTTTVLREQLFWHAVLFGSEKAVDFAGRSFSTLLGGEKVHPDIMRSLMQAGAFLGGEKTFGWLKERFKASQSEHERMNILAALGCFKQEAILEQVKEHILNQVPERNKSLAIGALAENVGAIPHMWQWYLTNHARLEAFHPVHYERVVAAIVPYGGLGKEEEVRGFFSRYMKKTDKAKDVIKLSLEKLEIHARMRKAFSAGS
ncbi:MAG: M1 family metallopeptidase [Deltaproteobacteria bacterium]|nr:M1 family metallopeptidase [Deltaproteobacteria bacterium]